jgi:hypothetical protein
VQYTKPHLFAAAASAAVQSTDKGGSLHLDNQVAMTWSNPPAYEADE